MPDLTVLIPYFNARGHIANAIDTICQQTYRPSHVILYDDGSTDGSHPIVETLARSRLTPLGIDFLNVREEQNRGRGYARQKLLSFVQTDLAAWLDADDTWHPHKLQSQLLFFLSLKKADNLIVFGNYKIFDKKTGAAHLVKMPSEINLNLIFGFESSPRALQLQTTLGPTKAFLSAGFDPSLNWSEDHDFAVRFLDRKGELINSCTNASFHVAQYNRTIPRNWEEVQSTHAYLLEKHLPVIRRLGLDEMELGIYKELKYTAHIYAACKRTDQLEDLLHRASQFRDDARFRHLYERCVAILESLQPSAESNSTVDQ